MVSRECKVIIDTEHMWAGITYIAVASRTQKLMRTSISDHMVAAHNAAMTPHVLCAAAAVKFQVA